MHNREREQQIIDILKRANGFVTVNELCEALYASPSSIRRDLRVLEECGLVKRSYGGATAVISTSSIMNFSHRTRENAQAKREIARKAVSLIRDGDVIFIDQSSSAFFLAGELAHYSGITVVTNNIEVMMLLSVTQTEVIATGGRLSEQNRNCLLGGDAQKTFENIYADVMFFSVEALDDNGVVSDATREEVLIRNVMMQNASKRVLLCDSTKFGKRAPFKQCDLSELDVLISEGEQAQHFAAFRNSIELM